MLNVDHIPLVRMESRLGFQYIEKSALYVKDNNLKLPIRVGIEKGRSEPS